MSRTKWRRAFLTVFLLLPQTLRLFFLIDLPAQFAVGAPVLVYGSNFILQDLTGLLD